MHLPVLRAVGALCLAVVLGTAHIAPPVTQASEGSRIREPVLLELFTSQGCSSCPPADRLARKLAGDQRLIVVSRPVTYWDRLGWKDTLALAINTDQQREYARTGLAGNNGVYTPQMVVNGRYGEVGADEVAILLRASQAAAGARVALRSRAGKAGGQIVGIAGTTRAAAEVVLWSVSRSVAVEIARGENGGRTVHYTNVLRTEQRLAEWNGGQQAVRIAADQLKGTKGSRYAVIVRAPDGGPVLAAHWLDVAG